MGGSIPHIPPVITPLQATSPNDHPNFPTFLRVYKLLSVYSIIKPPKSGNCTILDSTQPKLTLKDIKDAFSKNDILPERQLKINHLKERLDTLITQGIEVDNVFHKDIFRDHDYYKSDIEECVLYYICGYVSDILINTLSATIVKKQY